MLKKEVKIVNIQAQLENAENCKRMIQDLLNFAEKDSNIILVDNLKNLLNRAESCKQNLLNKKTE